MQQGFFGIGKDIHAEETGGHGANQAQGGDHRQAHHRGRLAALGVAVEVVDHLADLALDLGIQGVVAQARGAQPIHRLQVRNLRQLVEPVTVGEAQEGLETRTDAALEAADRVWRAHIQALDRIGQQLRIEQQGGAVEVVDQKQQTVLMAKLGEDAALGIQEKLGVGVADHQ